MLVGGALRDATKNGCVGDYPNVESALLLFVVFSSLFLLIESFTTGLDLELLFCFGDQCKIIYFLGF